MAKADTTGMTAQDFERFNETDYGVIFENGKAKVLDEAKLIEHQNICVDSPLCSQCRFYKAGVQEQIENALKPAFFRDYSKTKCLDCTEIARERRLKARRMEKIEEGLNPDVKRKRRTKTEILAQSTNPLAIPDEIREAMESISEMKQTMELLAEENDIIKRVNTETNRKVKEVLRENKSLKDEIQQLKLRVIAGENRVNEKHEVLDKIIQETETKAKEMQEMIYEFKNSYQTKSSIQAGIKAELEEIRIRLLDEVNSTVVPVQEQVQVCAENLDQLQELVESTIDSVATAPGSPKPPADELSQINSPTSPDEFPIDFDAADKKQAKTEWDNFEEVRARYRQACKEAEDRGEPNPPVEQFMRTGRQLPRPTFY